MELQTLQEALKVEIQVHQVSGILSCVYLTWEMRSSVRFHGVVVMWEFPASPSCCSPLSPLLHCSDECVEFKVSLRGKGGSAIRGVSKHTFESTSHILLIFCLTIIAVLYLILSLVIFILHHVHI